MSSDAGRPERIFLIGYRATGKTSLGKALAVRLGYEFHDTDSLLEERLGMSIARYFETRGEAAFRQQEVEVLRRIAASDGQGKGVGKGMVIRRRGRSEAERPDPAGERQDHQELRRSGRSHEGASCR